MKLFFKHLFVNISYKKFIIRYNQTEHKKKEALAMVFIACRFRMKTHKKFVFKHGWMLFKNLNDYEIEE